MMTPEHDKAMPRLQKIWDQGGTVHFDFVPGHTKEEYYKAVNQALDAMENGDLEPIDWDDGLPQIDLKDNG